MISCSFVGRVGRKLLRLGRKIGFVIWGSNWGFKLDGFSLSGGRWVGVILAYTRF